MNKLIIKNYIFYLGNLMLDLLFPLLLSPYITRVLGAEKIGTVNLANSVSAWFVLIVAFGIPMYGIREVAKVKNNKEELGKVFSELFILRVIMTIIGVCIFIIFLLAVPKFRNEPILYIGMILNLLLYIFSVDWFFQGIEKYQYLTIRNLLFKTITFVLTILLIKNSSNYIIYAYIQVLSLALFNMINFISCKKYVNIKFKEISVLKHFKKLKVFFIAALVTSTYTIFDSIVVGFMLDESSLAFYSRARQVIAMGLTLTLSLSTVLIPRISYLYDSDNKEEFKNTLIKSFKYILMISIPLGLGITILSKEIMYFFGGDEFIAGSNVMMVMAFIVVFDSIYTWTINQILVPTGNEKNALFIQILMAISNLSLNFILISKFGVIGAAYSILLTEIIGALVGIFTVRKIITLRGKKIYIQKYLLSGIAMSGFILFIKDRINNNLASLIVCGILGSSIYFIVLIILKEDSLFEVIRLANNKFVKKDKLI